MAKEHILYSYHILAKLKSHVYLITHQEYLIDCQTTRVKYRRFRRFGFIAYAAQFLAQSRRYNQRAILQTSFSIKCGESVSSASNRVAPYTIAYLITVAEKSIELDRL